MLQPRDAFNNFGLDHIFWIGETEIKFCDFRCFLVRQFTIMIDIGRRS